MSVERGPEKFIRSFLILTAVFSACKTRPEKNFPNSKVSPISELSLASFKPEVTSTTSPTPTEHKVFPTPETKKKNLTPENIIFPTATITIPPSTPTFTPSPLPTPTQEVIESEIILSLWEEKTYQAIQELREGRGLPTLELSQPLTEVARERSFDMATNNYFSHKNSEGREVVFDLLDKTGVYYSYAGEILYRTDVNDSQIDGAIQEVMKQFLGSYNHQKVLLRENYSLIGIGYTLSEEDNFRYVTIIFASP